MDDRYNSYFFNSFYAENGGGNYTDKEKWMPFFSMIADRLIDMFNPKTVLDAGCATGYLVEALRAKGVEAYGIDISAYAISRADDTIKPYVAVHSITEKLPKDFPKKFDLITTIEVLEHLFPEDGRKAIANLCSYSDTIIFTSTPDDVEDRTHCNVQLQEYWCKEFAANSFYHDLLQPLDFICPWAMLFKKRKNFENVIFDYEMNRRIDKLLYKKANEEYKARVYFDCGDGFNETNIVDLVYTAKNSCEIKIDLPLNCKNVRFDPVEDKYVAVKIYSAASDRGLIDFFPVNGTKLEDVVVFDNGDPQFVSGVKEGARWIKLNLFAYAFDSVEMIEMFMKLYKRNNDDLSQIKELNDKVNELNEVIISLRDNEEKLRIKLETETDELNEVIKSLRDNEEKYRLKLNDFHKEIKKTLRDKENINAQLIRCNEINNAILNSSCWKITKPLRKTVEFVRKFNIRKVAAGIYKGDFPYSIDKSIYENSIYNLKGWIFCLNNKTQYLKLIIETDNESFTIEEGLFNISRDDVYGAYKNEFAAKSGFEFSCLVSIKGKFKVILECKAGNKIKHISCGSFNGELSGGNENKVVSVVNDGKAYNIENIVSKYLTKEITDYSDVYKREYDIIIPVYNGFKYFKRLFETVDKTKAKINLIIINDCSTDERVSVFLNKYIENKDNVSLIEHSENMGFVKSVNEGLSLAQNDVVILNTDVEVPEMWLERLMLPVVSDEKTASVTPFTNSGTICSFPEFLKDNELFANGSVDEIDKAFRKIKPMYISAPTGVGFCMAMSKAAINDVGFLDDVTFEKGYGEENDWCQRAIKKGYKNVIAENLFVFHNHGGSFSSDEKKALIEKNSKLLLQKHPNYNRDVAIYCSENPHDRIRLLAGFMASVSLCKKVYVIFNHNLGGGATSYAEGYKREKINDNNAVITIAYDVSRDIYNMNLNYGDYESDFTFSQLENIIDLSELIKADVIVINELVTYPKIFKALDIIKSFKVKSGAELIYLMHDYYCICPTINLMDSYGKYCDTKTDFECCNSCLEKISSISLEYKEMGEWRINWKEFLNKCDEIRMFSYSSKEICEKAFGKLENIVVVPHKVEYLPFIHKKYKTTDTLNIGILGVLCRHKGIDIVEEMLNIIDKENLNIRIVVIGTSDKKFMSNNIVVTGKYTYDELPALALKNDIDVFFISSICPETFSYTAEEAMKMGYPVMSFDIGAPAERIKKYDKGYIVPEMSARASLKTAGSVELLPKNNSPKILFITDYISFSSRYRVEHFREELLINGVESDFISSDKIYKADISRYRAVVIYRSKHTREIENFINKAQRSGIKVYYDVDDLVFDYERISSLDFLKEEGYKDFNEYTQAINKCMSLCDGFITSTQCLKSEIERVFTNKPVCVNRNVISLEMLAISNKARLNKESNGNKVVLGYFSGSGTHNKDFDLIKDVLMRIMEENENVYIKIGGVLKVDKCFERYSKRILRFDFCDWKKLPELIGSVDINLMPLEESVFHECKSENKWTEAAAVGVCTVGSYNKELSIMIKNNENGFLCSTEEEWYNTLSKLIQSKELRNKIAESAHKTVIEKCTVITADKNAQDFVLKG